MTPRQQRIYNALYDHLQTFRFTRLNEAPKDADLIREIILKIDTVVAEELKKEKV